MYSDKNTLISVGLKITPQRIAVMEALHKLKSHPSAEMIISFIQKSHPHIAVGTIYKVLDLFVAKGIIRKVMTDKGVMRYDSVLDKHHHLYCSESGEIIDYVDEELDVLLKDYFERKKVTGFSIEEINLHLIGSYNKKKKE
ncbi:MAG: transcriptional repressor [Ignavibacteriales bacterium]|nr:transcriptional repressor [Ignavibacteriales bacterium]